MGKITNKKIVFIIAPNDFRDEEYFQPKVIIQSQGGEVATAVIGDLEEVTGSQGGKARPDVIFSEIKVEDYDGIVFVGGEGSKKYFMDQFVHKLINEFNDQSKIIGAICIAPSILANAGILNGRKVTSFKDQEENIIEKGGVWTGSDVEVFENIITADGPESALNFGTAVVNRLAIN